MCQRLLAKVCLSIQNTSNSGNIRSVYEDAMQATGSASKRSAPLKSETGAVITDRREQMGRWMKHYLDIYSTENTVSGEALHSIQSTPVIQELDAESTTVELEKVMMRPPPPLKLSEKVWGGPLKGSDQTPEIRDFGRASPGDGWKGKSPPPPPPLEVIREGKLALLHELSELRW